MFISNRNEFKTNKFLDNGTGGILLGSACNNILSFYRGGSLWLLTSCSYLDRDASNQSKKSDFNYILYLALSSGLQLPIILC